MHGQKNIKKIFPMCNFMEISVFWVGCYVGCHIHISILQENASAIFRIVHTQNKV